MIDNAVTYCDSQNCAGSAFLAKKGGPWVDVMLRLTGPILRQDQHVFVSGWMGNEGDDLTDILGLPKASHNPGKAIWAASGLGTRSMIARSMPSHNSIRRLC